MQSTLRFSLLRFNDVKTYLVTVVFVIGNIVFPQLFHLMPQGGVTWLPIYFFTLMGAYKYGWRVGLMTAIVSPLINSCLFDMPTPSLLPAIMMKSVLLAIAAGYVAYRFKKVSLILLIAVVVFYQVAGTLGEWVLYGDFYRAIQDFRIGLPGMVLQVYGSYILLRWLN